VDSLCGTQASNYAEAARAAGREVRQRYLCQLAFGPMLRTGYHEIQALQPDLVKAQKWISWAQQLVFVYPNRGAA